MILLTLAQSSGKNGNAAVSLLPIVLLIVVFYFFMMRPQRTRMRMHQELLRNLGVGDEVETVGGIFGTIRGADDDSFQIEISPGTTVRVSRGSVRRKIYEEEETPSSDSSA